MPKKNIMITVDEEIIKDAKEKGMNVSSAAEQGIFSKLKKTSVTFDEPKACEICLKPGRRERGDEINQDKHFSVDANLTWLYPDEKWLCNKCLRTKCEIVRKGKR